MKPMQTKPNMGKPIDYASKLNLYGKITEKHAEEINEMINSWIDETKKEVIDHISFNEGWEETGDKYRKYFGIEPVFNQAHWNEETETVRLSSSKVCLKSSKSLTNLDEQSQDRQDKVGVEFTNEALKKAEEYYSNPLDPDSLLNKETK